MGFTLLERQREPTVIRLYYLTMWSLASAETLYAALKAAFGAFGHSNQSPTIQSSASGLICLQQPEREAGAARAARLATTSTAMTWSSGCRRSIGSSFPAGGIETQDHLDDRALPDRLRSLDRHLYGH
jgi:hypothetical protein